MRTFFVLLFFLSDGLNEELNGLPELQSSSIIMPHDQRAPLSSTESFKTNNNKQQLEPQEHSLYLLPSCLLTTLGLGFSFKMESPLFISFISSFTKPSSLLASLNKKRKKKNLCLLNSFICPQRHIWLGSDISQRGLRQMWLPIREQGRFPASRPYFFPTFSAGTDGEAYMKRLGAAG